LIRDYLGRLTVQIDPQQAAEESAELARSHVGRFLFSFLLDMETDVETDAP
jgi:hypothetical protein